jgi:hypothetical protein
MTGHTKNQLRNNVANSAGFGTITNLYDLIGALNKKIEPNNDNLVTAVVSDLIETGKIKWIRPRKKFYQFDC